METGAKIGWGGFATTLIALVSLITWSATKPSDSSRVQEVEKAKTALESERTTLLDAKTAIEQKLTTANSAKVNAEAAMKAAENEAKNLKVAKDKADQEANTAKEKADEEANVKIQKFLKEEFTKEKEKMEKELKVYADNLAKPLIQLKSKTALQEEMSRFQLAQFSSPAETNLQRELKLRKQWFAHWKVEFTFLSTQIIRANSKSHDDLLKNSKAFHEWLTRLEDANNDSIAQWLSRQRQHIEIVETFK